MMLWWWLSLYSLPSAVKKRDLETDDLVELILVEV